jgi:hypothetical protein
MIGQTALSSTALRCLDRQLAEALDLVVACHQLSDRARGDRDSRTVMVLQRLASDLTDLASSLVPVVGVEHGATTPPLSEGSSSGADSWLAELDNRLGLVALAAEVDAMSPGLETSVVRLLSKLAAVYQSSRGLLLAAAARDRA